MREGGYRREVENSSKREVWSEEGEEEGEGGGREVDK